MDILEKIVAFKKEEVALLKISVPIEKLKKGTHYKKKGLSLKQKLIEGEEVGIIAEYKRKSPSKGIINDRNTVSEVTSAYMNAGVSALSVLTDGAFFGGSLEDLTAARQLIQIPILRKEFIVDPYQIHESKSYGADLILLIAEVLTKEEVYAFSSLAHELDMEVLLEIHSLDQLEKLSPYIDIIGVNNRNLKTFEVSIENAINMYDQLPMELAKISESGIHTEAELLRLKAVGYQGFLIGERFMKTDNPGKACKVFIDNVVNSFSKS